MKSKRWISLMLALMLCLSCLTAFAENSVIVKTDYNSANYVRAESACVVGDTVYMTGQSETAFGLYYWKKGMEAPVPLKSEKELIADTSIIFDDMSEEELAEQLALLEENGSDASHALGILFTDGERLLNMNTVTGLVCVVNVNEEIVTFDDVIQIADTNPLYHHEADYMYQSNRNGFAYAGNKLLVAIEDYDNNSGENINNIVIFDLETGKTTISAVPYVTGISNYRDGKAIVTIFDWTTYYENPDVRPVLATYDPETDTVSEFATLSSTNIRGLGYLPAMDRIAYAANNRLMGISLKDGSEKQLGFYQGSFYSSSPLQAFGEDSVLMQNWDSVALRTVSEDFSADVSLTLYGDMSAKGQALFSQRFDNVPIYSSANSYYDSLEAFSQAMVSGNDSLDVMTLYANQSMFTAMRDKGYCADLSGYPELVAAVQRMHPCFQDIVTKDGKIYGIPVEAYSSGWFVDNTVMETYGLTEGDLPTNLLDFFSFVNEWNDKAGEEDLDVVLLDDGWKDSIFYEVLQKYIEWCQYQGKDLSFDTPEFRAVMRGFEQTRTDNLGENNYDEESYTPALLSPYYTVIGNFNLKERYASFVPMALTPDTEPVYGATVTVMCINPRTKNMDMAVNLLLCALEGMEENEKHVLFADAIEPVENEYLESEMARGKKYIADLEAELAKETDEDIRQGLQEAIDAEKAWMESYVVDYRYTISPEGIEMYQNMIVPHMFASAPNPIFNYADSSSSELRSLCDRYLDKQISLDQFIKEADNKLMMIRLENN